MGMLSPRSSVPNIPVGSNQITNNSVKTEEISSQPTSTEEVNTYLDEKRGKIGTILTSWKGLMDKYETLPRRKTLLGE
jgi:hypothetical protein